MDNFTQAYIECAIWADARDEDGEPYDGELASLTRDLMVRDCADFQRDNAALLAAWYDAGESEERAGHDFWLTRNGHGAGYWDRGIDDLGKQLTDVAHACGSQDLYVGDDGLIYLG